MKFAQKKENLKNEIRRTALIGKNTLLCVFDWFEVRVEGEPSIEKLNLLGYDSNLDKGCATHSHYFENDTWSVSWDIKSPYIKQVYTHVRLKNHLFYTEQLRTYGLSQFMQFVLGWCFDLPVNAFVSRMDICIDMREDSDTYNYIKHLFISKNLVSSVTRYGEISGVHPYTREKYVNYYAGNRSAFAFYRLYNKYIENTDKNGISKKQYITDLHNIYFGTDRVVRFEIELKPQRLNLNDLDADCKYFNYIKSERILCYLLN